MAIGCNIPTFVIAACLPLTGMAASVDLSSWTVQGDPSAQWLLSADNFSAIQTQNGLPTYLIAPGNKIDTLTQGTFGVETAEDDDLIGFVFGWQPAADPRQTTFLVFSWKQDAPDPQKPGFALASVVGTGNPKANNHGQSQFRYTVLDNLLGDGLGWQDNTKYQFSLDHTQERVQIAIKDLPLASGGNGGSQFGLNGTTIFDLTGTFPDGQFGFFNYSQADVRYTGITQVPSPSTVSVVPAPAAAGLGLIGGLGLVMRRRRHAC